MDNYSIQNDIPLICVKADSFPDGIQAAFNELRARLKGGDRKLFGLSHPVSDGRIIYKAAAEELYPGEAAALSCERFVVKKGLFVSELVTGLPEKIHDIATTFQRLLQTPGIDPNGYCLEMYESGKEVRCMVRLSDQ